jgi:hypothetical protein
MWRWSCGFVFTNEDLDVIDEKLEEFKRTHKPETWEDIYDYATFSRSAEEHMIGLGADKFVDVEVPFRDIDTGVLTFVKGLQTFNIPYFYIVPLAQRPRYLCETYKSEKEMVKEFKKILGEFKDFLPDDYDYIDHLVCLDIDDGMD